ncbi:hypothetical protein MTR67_044443 [Solanum verrucosum]|uniref:Uncharacterized protein n=1 Tax=Solanum verrucosum TaxID=315347 RepID=A0AAF0UTF5_SOLVR|nr:hypothetical protein MTR67_044443 [Solanum verrucosum]
MKLNDSVFYSAPTASKSFQGIGHREDSIVQPVVDQHISHPAIPVLHKLLGKTFTIQIKKLFAKNKDASSAKLFIMSITEKDIASNLPLPLTAPTTPESSKHKLKQIMRKED